jgi:hypothetical protein
MLQRDLLSQHFVKDLNTTKDIVYGDTLFDFLH